MVTEIPEVQKLMKQLTDLTAQIKAKQVELKRISDEVQHAREEANAAIFKAENDAHNRQYEIAAQLDPHEHLLATAKSNLEATVKEQNAKLESLRESYAYEKNERTVVLSNLDRQITEKTARLAAMQAEIVTCQEKVKAL